MAAAAASGVISSYVRIGFPVAGLIEVMAMAVFRLQDREDVPLARQRQPHYSPEMQRDRKSSRQADVRFSWTGKARLAFDVHGDRADGQHARGHGCVWTAR